MAAQDAVGGPHRDAQDCIEMLEPKVMIMDDGLARYVCPQCGVKYKKLSALRGHMKECGKGAQCPLCPKIVTQRRNLAKHMERHRRDGLMEFHNFIDSFPLLNSTF
uniref:C2H2-type domain-containing protein n=1 Tax=Culex tarsalis TaxID=7177 RepID=A0A1Q3EYU7_CULTA